MKCYKTLEEKAGSVKKDLFQGQWKPTLPLRAGACLASGDSGCLIMPECILVPSLAAC